MITFINENQSLPYRKFKELYINAIDNNQNNIDALCVSSYNEYLKQVDARYVNLKYIIDNQWIFFTNYNSKKAQDFNSHPQISSLIFWDKINTQIRIKAKISKTNEDFSDKHYFSRTLQKNALAWSSKQSETIKTYDEVIKNYESALSSNIEDERPSFWGGFTFIPYYFEFWQGNDNRINKRQAFHLNDKKWKMTFLQP